MNRLMLVLALVTAIIAALQAVRASFAKPVPVVIPHCFVKAKNIGDPQWFLPCSDVDVYYDA